MNFHLRDFIVLYFDEKLISKIIRAKEKKKNNQQILNAYLQTKKPTHSPNHTENFVY